ncbi:OstA-like protein [Muribaculum intestinale]|uniref:OstA-like protein n=1 Tax=Muribaculum intestinale TaxID=1796646 RepID=UPI000B2BEDF2|nr:OstA-like protein [Muribaculum intestinale]
MTNAGKQTPNSNRQTSGKHKARGMHAAFCIAAGMVCLSVIAAAQQPGPKSKPVTPARKALLQPDSLPISPTIPGANRYQRDKVFLERANEMRAEQGKDYQIVVGDVEFRKGDMFMYCDSAHFYDNPGALQAYGNVRMEQGDTLFVYADELNYADSTQLAILYADPGKKVRLINKDVTLTTDVFNYDMGIELGYYEVGGVLTDKENRLDSWYGEYSPSSKDALFKENVHLNSLGENDTLDIYTEEMLYNTLTHIAILDTTSTIISADGTIYTTSGVYNTETSQADLYHRSLVVASNGNTLTGDTLYYDRNLGFGEAFGNIELTDTTNKVILNGDYGFYFEIADSALVTGRALAKEYSSPSDTLYMHGDTIRTFIVITPEQALNDSVTVPADTTHHLIAAPHVKFFRNDLQGLCDSMTFVQRDSMMYMNYHPVVWNESKQIFGNVIQVHLRDSTADWARLPEFGFMAEWIDEEFYNQLTGKEMYATFANGTIKHLDVSGNVQAIMLPMENDSTYNKIANLESSFLSADFKNQTIEYLKMWPETPGTMTPLYLAKKSLFYLPQFRWLEPLRPTSPQDVFNIPPEFLMLMEEPPFGQKRSR